MYTFTKNARKGFYTGKLFEYMASLRPILALVDKDDIAAQLIRESMTGYIADSENIGEIKAALLQAYNDWREHGEFEPNIEIIKKHHRREQAKRLQGLIMEFVNKHTAML
jgi:hypothetical protein